MGTSLYQEMEAKTIKNYTLRCIDGSIRGCGKCVGYCDYEGHVGFLTAKMQEEHQCVEKECYYHYPKPAAQKRPRDERSEDNNALERSILSSAQIATAAMEGLRVIRVATEPDAGCVVYYAAIAEYDLSPVAEQIAASTGCHISMNQIPCDFDTAIELVMYKC